MKPLNVIQQQESGDLEIVHPVTNEPLRAFLVLAGPRHPVRERLELDKSRQLRRQFNKRGAVELDDPEEDRKRALDFIVACTLGWYSLEDQDGGAPAVRVEAVDFGRGPEPYSANRAREVYSDAALSWIKLQAQEGLHKQELFIKDSSRTSSPSSAGSPGSAS